MTTIEWTQRAGTRGETWNPIRARDRAGWFCVKTAGGFRLSGKTWPVEDARVYVGNWCWNGYWLRLPAAADFLIWLRGRGVFDVESGWCEVFEWWRGERALPDAKLFLQFQLALAQRENRP